MGAPSRTADVMSLLTSALNHTLSVKAELTTASPAAVAAVDAAIAAITDVIAHLSVRSGAEAAPTPVARAVGNETLLVVEDNETILTLVTTALRRFGYTVLSAGDGPTALERYGRSADDIKLLVTDLMMPRMSGRELAIQLTALRPTLKVLYASGYTQDVTSRHGVFEPDVNFIQKPYTPQRLAARIRLLLDTPSD
jgi:CheY-like chemotaxis protein